MGRGGVVVKIKDGIRIGRIIGDARTTGVQHRPDQIPGARPLRHETNARPGLVLGLGLGLDAPGLHNNVKWEPRKDLTNKARFKTKLCTGLLNRDDAILKFEISPPQRAVHGYKPLQNRSPLYMRCAALACKSHCVTMPRKIGLAKSASRNGALLA